LISHVYKSQPSKRLYFLVRSHKSPSTSSASRCRAKRSFGQISPSPNGQNPSFAFRGLLPRAPNSPRRKQIVPSPPSQRFRQNKMAAVRVLSRISRRSVGPVVAVAARLPAAAEPGASTKVRFLIPVLSPPSAMLLYKFHQP
jgi:hypothetical protein